MWGRRCSGLGCGVGAQVWDVGLGMFRFGAWGRRCSGLGRGIGGVEVWDVGLEMFRFGVWGWRGTFQRCAWLLW